MSARMCLSAELFSLGCNGAHCRHCRSPVLNQWVRIDPGRSSSLNRPFLASTAGPTIVRMRSTAVELLEREYNLRRLEESLAQAREGRGRIVAVAGEAGAGKTVLIERFAAKSAAAAQIYWSACENLSTPEVLLPLRDISRASGESFNLGADNIRVFESVLDLLSRKSKPSVLVIEDVHWADT